MFKIRNFILHFFIPKLRVKFDSILGHINDKSRVTKIFLKKSPKLDYRQKLYLIPIFL